jgi:hypothetical protein
MIIRNLDSNGDWTFGQGKQNYLTGNAAIGLNIRTRLLSWVNDCFFDLRAGIDWTNRLGSKNQRSLLEADLRRVILQSYGVTGIVSFDTVLNGRTFSARYSVNTIFSTEFTDSVTQEI